jgi:hypothetical protein
MKMVVKRRSYGSQRKNRLPRVVLVSVGWEKNCEGDVLMVTGPVGGDNHGCLSSKG